VGVGWGYILTTTTRTIDCSLCCCEKDEKEESELDDDGLERRSKEEGSGDKQIMIPSSISHRYKKEKEKIYAKICSPFISIVKK
jgi:hypothetical protein